MLTKTKIPLVFVVSTAAVYFFDRTKLVLTFQKRSEFPNSIPLGADVLLPEYSSYFRLLSFFDTLEVLIYIVIMVLAMFFLGTKSFARSLPISLTTCYFGTILGHALGGTTWADAEFHQTYLMSVGAALIVASLLNVLGKVKENGPD